MVQSKDASFKFISKKHLQQLFEILNFHFGIDLDFSDVNVLTLEDIVIEPSLVRPDYVVKIGNIIFMVEFESSHVGIKKKKLFKLYVSSFDYNNNDDNDRIIFFVVSTKENSKMASYSINDWDSFKFPIISLKDLDKEKIINNIQTKIDNNDDFTNRDLLELALTPILENNKDEIINQFFETKDLMSEINYPSEEIKTSVYGIVLMLSSMYFDELDSFRKKLQGDLMGKVDCVREAINESFDDGKYERSVEIAKNLLVKGNLSLREISEIVDIPLEDVEKLKLNL